MPSDAGPRTTASGKGRAHTLVRALVLATVLGATVLGATACGATSDGRTLREPRVEQTTTTAAPTASADPGSISGGDASSTTATAVEPLALQSSAMQEGEEIPARHTCRGDDVSPPLLWAGIPAGTVELAVVVRDVDLEGFVHWVVAGLPPDLAGLADGTLPAGAVEAANDFGRTGWGGPCPPSGTHTYEFRLYALAQPSGVVTGEAGADAAAKVEGAPALGSVILSAVATAG